MMNHRAALVVLSLFTALLFGSATTGAQAAAKAVIEFNDAFDAAALQTKSAAAEQVEGGLKITYSASEPYPAVHFTAPDGAWDLSDYNAVEFDLVNTGDTPGRVHGRLDNPGDWRQSPWSINAVHLKPGDKKTLRVPFGKSYGNPGYALDPARIKEIVVFVEHPKAPVTIQVSAVRAVQLATTGGDNAGNTANDIIAEAPGGSGMLYDFEDGTDLGKIRNAGAAFEIVTAEGGGKALKATFAAGESYPAVHLDAPSGAWNLSNYAGVQVDVTNPGPHGITAAMRVDNPGRSDGSASNAEKIHLKSGETKTLRVTFGQSWGAPGFSLNSAKVVRALVYAERPQAGSVLLIDNLKAYGQATVREMDTVDLEGMLFDFGRDFILDGRVEERGASATLDNGRLIATYDVGEQWPAVYLKPLARKWDLSNFKSVEMQVTNLSSAPARVQARIDNPGANGTDHCNVEAITLEPNATKTLTVTFGRSWGNKGFDLDPSNVIGVLVMVDQPKQAYRIAIDDIKANRKEFAEVPEWVGTRPPVEGDWVQTLDENFDGDKLDESRWTPRLVWDGPAGAETQRYLQENVYLEDGKLVIKCERNPGHQYNNPQLPTREYATGAVTTLDKWTQAYGYFEARIKRPGARGLWPAFWMMPDRGEGNGDIWQRRATENGGMEIDIWEHLTEWGPNRYNIAAHWDGYDKAHKQWGNAHIYHLPTQDGWNHYGLLWEPGKLTWFCDGRKVGEWKNERVTSVPLYLKFTVQMGNWATKNVDVAALPDFFQIDYVRAWQLRERMSE